VNELANKIKIGLLGSDGKMGKLIASLILQDPQMQILHAYTIPESPNLGLDLGLIVSGKPNGVKIVDTVQFEADCNQKKPDVVIDFTIAEGTEKNAPIALKAGIPMVIGTTGLSKEFTAKLDALCKENKCAVVKSTNMAVGVNIFFKIAEEIAKCVPTWDIEIVEAHHNQKKDAPSGTALTTAERIAKVLQKNLDEIAKYGRPKGPAPRKKGADEIGIHAIRAGDIVGDHTVIYAGQGERIELIHRAHSRECFASGALKAAKFIIDKKKDAKIFDMQTVLNL
jgi:4-hydroxy-tetrahydrodipicolinate reductase